MTPHNRPCAGASRSPRTRERRALWLALWTAFCCIKIASADPPAASYIFPAGGQRGTRIAVRIGGCNLYDAPRLIWTGQGVAAPPVLSPIERIWFEGPLIPQPASQAREDYPRDFAATIDVAADAPLGRQFWRLATSQGVTAAWGFVVGDLPEIVERESDGPAPPVAIALPVTVNGRIFPREDVDEWQFAAVQGQTVTCHIATAAFGSPLRARLTVLAADGTVLRESLPERAATPPLRFVAPAAGDYVVRIQDVRSGGLQDHVYRLTVTAGPFVDAVYPLGGRRGAPASFELSGANLPSAGIVISLPQTDDARLLLQNCASELFGDATLDVDDLDDVCDCEPSPLALPCAINGRIAAPAELDTWTFAAKKDVGYEFEVRAARLGSPLDAVLLLSDANGKQLAEVDDTIGLDTDARLRWTAPADGDYLLTIRDSLPDRGDVRFVYRLRATIADRPDFALAITGDTAILERGQELVIKVALERNASFNEPVELRLEGLPTGVTVASSGAIPANKNDGQFVLKAAADAPIDVSAVQVLGVAQVGEQEFVRRAAIAPKPATPDDSGIAAGDDRLWVAVTRPAPFKFAGAFETRYISRGSVFVRHYRLERNGFDGPLTVQLADRQGRHLQGVTAAPVVVPAEASEFDFAVTLPPWMEIGRTCRSTLAVTGVTTDADGRRHTVSYSSNDQHNQMIALVDPGRLAVQLPRETLTARPGARVELPVRVQRDAGLKQAVALSLTSLRSSAGVSAAPLEIDGNAAAGMLNIECSGDVSEAERCIVHAVTRDEQGFPVTAEAWFVLVRSR